MKRSVLKCVGSVMVLLAMVTAGCASSPKKLYKKGDMDSVIDVCAKAIQANANDTVAYFYRAHAYADKREYDKAIADYTEVLRLDQSIPGQTTYYYRGMAYMDKGDIDNAIADFTELLNIRIGELRLFADAGGTIYLDAGDNPIFTTGYWERGYAYFINGEYDHAFEDFSKVIEKSGILDATVLSHRYCGEIYARRGEHDHAIADLTEAIRLDPQFAVAYNSRGNAYYYKGEYDRAIADYTEVIRLDPKAVVMYNVRGIAYYSKGDYDRARADWEKVLQIDPNNADARQNLETLRNEGH
jgi:tetratricopeptide (TPR) repeat protein